MASHTRASRQALPMDETTRTFGDAGASAAVSLDGEIGDLDANGPTFSNKPDPRLRRCLWLIVPLLVFSGGSAVVGLFMHMGGSAHPESRKSTAETSPAASIAAAAPTPAAVASTGTLVVSTESSPAVTATMTPTPSLSPTPTPSITL